MKYCPKCNKMINDQDSYCCFCGTKISEPTTDYRLDQSSATSISGQIFTVESSVYVSPDFSSIAEKFDKNIDAEINQNDFVKSGIELSSLNEFVRKGYLVQINNMYKLSEFGMKMYRENKRIRNEIEKNMKKIIQDLNDKR